MLRSSSYILLYFVVVVVVVANKDELDISLGIECSFACCGWLLGDDAMASCRYDHSIQHMQTHNTCTGRTYERKSHKSNQL